MNSAKGYGNATFSDIVLFLISPVPNPPCTNHVKTERIETAPSYCEKVAPYRGKAQSNFHHANWAIQVPL